MTSEKVFVPPLKTQGIKTKLVPLIRQNALVYPDTLWIEPFMGSGVVGFNLAPSNAIFADTNPHIIQFYNQLKIGSITAQIVRDFLEQESYKLSAGGGDYYYEVRSRFNQTHNPLDFLFLNRSCFNGMIRFNRKLEFNVPYCQKPDRFSKAYITKIVNQVAHIESRLRDTNWVFLCQDFEKTLSFATQNAFIYCDPPYIGRHVDYYDRWDEASEIRLCTLLKACNTHFMLSTWDHNRYRQNEYLPSLWAFCHKITHEHFYHVGAKEANRASMLEALLTNYLPQSAQHKKNT